MENHGLATTAWSFKLTKPKGVMKRIVLESKPFVSKNYTMIYEYETIKSARQSLWTYAFKNPNRHNSRKGIFE